MFVLEKNLHLSDHLDFIERHLLLVDWNSKCIERWNNKSHKKCVGISKDI